MTIIRRDPKYIPRIMIDDKDRTDWFRSFCVEDKVIVNSNSSQGQALNWVASQITSTTISAVVDSKPEIRQYFTTWVRNPGDERTIEHYPDGIAYEQIKTTYEVTLCYLMQSEDTLSLEFYVKKVVDSEHNISQE